LYQATGLNLTDQAKDTLISDNITAANMLYCFLISPNCELLKQVVKPKAESTLTSATQPFPLYVSVSGTPNTVTSLVMNLLSSFTGSRTNHTEDQCTEQNQNSKRYRFSWRAGPLKPDNTRDSYCNKANTLLLDATSPAFEIVDYDWMSGEYSTWTESRWASDSISARIFLLPSQGFQVSILMVGLLVFLLSLCLAWFLHSRKDIIFAQQRSHANSTVYNPML